MPLPKNRAIIAAAGARKTQTIVDEALANPSHRVLVTTYTIENLRQLEQRIAAQAGGVVPANITIAGWFTVLLRDGIKPYQVNVFREIGVVGGLNFVGKKPRYASNDSRHAYVDSNYDVYRDSAAHLACRINAASGGRVVARLEAMYERIFIDEVQDLVGYDLDFLDLLFASEIPITVVGDPRQYTFSTNDGPRNKQFRGVGMLNWIDARVAHCAREDRVESYRCNQAICDYASALFPGLPAMVSRNTAVTGHDGIIPISRAEVQEYYSLWRPQVLCWAKNSKTEGLPAMNFGVAKGSTFDRVLIFPTTSMKAYITNQNSALPTAAEKFYVGVTRAKYSVALVID